MVVAACSRKRPARPARLCPKRTAPISLTSGLRSVGTGCSFQARTVMAPKLTARMPPIQVRTLRALTHSTGRNTETPLEIASTPVRAVVPLA